MRLTARERLDDDRDCETGCKSIDLIKPIKSYSLAQLTTNEYQEQRLPAAMRHYEPEW